MNSEELNNYLKKSQEKGLDLVGVWQVKIAANMGLPLEKLELISLPNLSFANREWIYIAMMEGIPAEWLAELPQVTAQSVIDLRRKYFQKEYGKEPEYIKNLTVIQEEVKKQLEESRILCSFLREQGEKEQKDLGELRETVRQKTDEARRLAEENAVLAARLESVSKENMILQETLSFRPQESSNDNPKRDDIEKRETGTEQGNTGTTSENMDIAEKGPVWRHLSGWFRKRNRVKQNLRENEEFIIMLQKVPFSLEQKSYLLKCREEGEDMAVIRSIAYESFDIHTMERIRKLLSGCGKMEKEGGCNDKTGKNSSDDGGNGKIAG